MPSRFVWVARMGSSLPPVSVGGIGAGDLHAWRFGMGEAGIVRRERARRECLVGDDAAALPRCAAERDRLKRTPDVLAFGDLDIEPENEGAGEEALLGLALDLMGDEPREDSRALRMADQHDAAAVVVMREVMSPRRAHILIRKLEIHRERLVSEHSLDARERHLAVDGRERAADRGEAPRTAARPRRCSRVRSSCRCCQPDLRRRSGRRRSSRSAPRGSASKSGLRASRRFAQPSRIVGVAQRSDAPGRQSHASGRA